MWREVEADFLRDYGVRIDADLHHMSWRRFQALFSGLSPDGAVARALCNQNDPESARSAGRSFIDWLGVRASKEAKNPC